MLVDDNPPAEDEGSNKSVPLHEFKLQVPQWGGIQEVDKGMWAAWTGGKPKGDWLMLEV